MNADDRALLGFLDGVRPAPSGVGWTATCPSCSRPGLRVRPSAHGTGYVELDCAGGCSLSAILDAIDRRRL